MPKILIKDTEYSYEETDIIFFEEGIIGFPQVRRAVLIPLPGCEPFCWLASVDDQLNRFIVVEAREIFTDYKPDFPAALFTDAIRTLAIVNVSSSWQKTSVNLRAPILFNHLTKKAAQFILTESRYQLAATLPTN